MKNNLVLTFRTLMLFIAAVFIFTACEKEGVLPQPPNPGSGVFFVNQGSFGRNNASVTFFNTQENQAESDIYALNNGESLGDIAQSISLIKEKLYIVVNNSGKIVMIDPGTYKKENQITGLTSPRYIVEASSGKAYVSDLFSNMISVVDLNTLSVIKTIPCAGWTEEMVSRDGKTYVANINSEYLYVISHATDAITDSILVGKGATSLAFDRNGKLWMAFGQLYGENFIPTENGKIKQLNITTKILEKNLTVASGGADKLRMLSNGETFYYLNNSAYRMNITDNELPPTPFFSKPAVTFYSLGVDVENEILYVSDAGDFLSNGTVYQVDRSKNEINNFKAGIAPGEFLIYNK